LPLAPSLLSFAPFSFAGFYFGIDMRKRAIIYGSLRLQATLNGG
jgi:hypothetical protein